MASTLGSLLRGTLQQVGVVKEAVERQARSSRMRLDEVVLQRKRHDTLARLGELVYELAEQGKLGDLEDEVPELANLLADVEELDEQLGDEPEPDHDHDHDHEPDHDHEAVSSADWTPPARQARAGAPRQHEELRVWRPVVTDPVDEGRGPRGERAADERGDADERGGEESEPGARAAGGRAARLGRGASRSRMARSDRGGIAFITDDVADGDDDLARYMHPDDVPDKDGA